MTYSLVIDQPCFPCRCGEVHVGDYGQYDYGHHECFHDSPLWQFSDLFGGLMCPDCGKTFWIGS